MVFEHYRNSSLSPCKYFSVTQVHFARWLVAGIGSRCQFDEMGLLPMRIRQPYRRHRMPLVSELSIAMPTLHGSARELALRTIAKAKTVKIRTHSLFRQGLMLY